MGSRIEESPCWDQIQEEINKLKTFQSKVLNRIEILGKRYPIDHLLDIILGKILSLHSVFIFASTLENPFPGYVLFRSLMEATGLLEYTSRFLDNGNKLEQVMFGTRLGKDEPKAVNVMDFIRALAKKETYFEDLYNYYSEYDHNVAFHAASSVRTGLDIELHDYYYWKCLETANEAVERITVDIEPRKVSEE